AAKPSRTNPTNQRKKVICNCNKCNRSLVDYRTKDAYKNKVQQSPKRQSLDLSFYKLTLLLQEQSEGSRSLQNITEVKISDTLASVQKHNFLKSSTESGENLGNNNVFEDYSASDFDSEMSPES
ncbi:11604_t:CDS:2, partial [Racocetra persica]